MAKIILDLSGRGGLLERYQGDLNDTTSSPHLRYLGGDNQFAEGQWNPFSYYGFMSPPNNTFTELTGTVSAPINSFAFDSGSGVLYASEDGLNILQLSDLESVAATNYKTITTGTIKDMIRYEVNNAPALLYAIDSGTSDGMYVGFNAIDPEKGMQLLNAFVGDSASPPSLISDVVPVADENYSTLQANRLAQQFYSSDLASASVSSVNMLLSRESGTGTGVTLKVSIQGESDPGAGAYTSQGAWLTATAYAVNDTVTNGGQTWMCHAAHTSSPGDEPGVGAGWEDFWNEFGAPDGVDIASANINMDDLSDLTATSDIDADERTSIVFSTPATLTASTKYWLVLEEVGTNMTTGDKVSWMSTINGNSVYSYNTGGVKAGYARVFISGTSFWRDINQNGDVITADHDNYDFEFISNSEEKWSSTSANGFFSVDEGQDTYMYLADNGLVYWVTGNQVHSIDGSATGGVTGTVNQGILLFPSYATIPDISETRGRMYIGVQTSQRTTSDDKFFNAYRAGIFVWDRRSQVLGGTDFFPTPGAKEIRNIFTSSTGDIVAITVNNSGFSEIRQLSGNQFAVIQTLEKDAYPASRRGISQVGNFSIWLGINGIFYAYGSVAPGEPLRLFKIGSAAGLTGFATPGALFVGNKDTSNNELAVYFGWDTGAAYNISKWYPNGEGTIDTLAQKAGVGNVYTRVQQLPGLSTVRYIRGFHMQGGTDGDTTVAATLKCYTNLNPTAAWSRPITYDELYKGWFEKEWNKQNVNFLQFEVEWNTTPTLGTDTYRPMYLEIETEDEGRINS